MNRAFSTRTLGQVIRPWPARVLFVLPLLAGCPGTLGGGYPGPVGGTGGASMSGSGGSSTGGSSTGGTNGGSTGGTNGSSTGGTNGGSATGGTSGTVACDAPTQVFAKSCAISGCHLMLFPPDLSAATAAQLKGANAATSTPPCAGQPLLNSANPSTSPILLRVLGSTCGPQMPDKQINPSVSYLSQTDIDCLTSWVNANAN